MAPKSRSYQTSALPVTILAHLLFISITTLVLVWLLHFREGFAFNSINKAKIFNLHPFLMIIGFILIGGEAIMAYKTVPGTRQAQKIVHIILHLLALGAGILGICIVFKFKNEAGLSNMITLHSWLGIVTISLFGLQWLLGFFTYAFPGAEMSTRATMRPWHIFVGMVIFVLAICAAMTGLVQIFDFFKLSQEALIINFTGLLLFLFAVTVSLTVVLPRVY